MTVLNAKPIKSFGFVFFLSCAIATYFFMFTKYSSQWDEVLGILGYNHSVNQTHALATPNKSDPKLKDHLTKVLNRTKRKFMKYDTSIDPNQKSTPVFDAELKDQLKEALEKAQEKEYTILVWAAMFGVKYPYYVDPDNCGKCAITHDKSLVSDPDTKAVIFYFTDLNLTTMPPNRRPDQLYVWWTLEASPALYTLRGITLKNLNGIFNLTMTYRNHSDVYYPFFFTAKSALESIQKSGSGDPQKDIDDLMSKKIHLAFWVVSNCGSSPAVRRRMQYAKQIIKAGLALDTFGHCFYNRLKSMDIAKRYKFYFTFDNGYHCNDHISEKFHNALKHDAVPVIFGAKKIDYEKFGPSNSFIHTDDFKTPAKLVEYLNYLDQNDTAYKEYFKWRTMSPEDMPHPYRAWGFCHLCRILHGINVDNIYNPMYNELYSDIPLFGYPKKPRIVDSLPKFFYDTEDQQCLPDYFLIAHNIFYDAQ